MTTIIGVKCKDGILMCSDTQSSTDTVKDSAVKIKPIGDLYLFGGAGASPYINHFYDILSDSLLHSKPNQTEIDKINTAILNYSSFIQEWNKKVEFPVDPYPHVLLGSVQGQSFHLWHIETPNIAEEVKDPFRSTIGTGGEIARHYFLTVERFLDKYSNYWVYLSTKLIAQFCYLLISNILRIDLKSGGRVHFWKIDNDGVNPYPLNQFFTSKNYIAELTTSIIKEIPECKEYIASIVVDIPQFMEMFNDFKKDNN